MSTSIVSRRLAGGRRDGFVFAGGCFVGRLLRGGIERFAATPFD